MKHLKFFRATKVHTDPKICLEVMFGYTHFLYRHKSSFADFKVIKETESEQVFYYKTKVFNFLPISPIRRYISIKKLVPEEKMFKQVYLDLQTKRTFYFKCQMENENNEVTINNYISMPVSNSEYFFRKPLLWLINKKFDVMWNEDKPMLSQISLKQNYSNHQCIPKNFNLDSFFNDFDVKIGENGEFDLRIS